MQIRKCFLTIAAAALLGAGTYHTVSAQGFYWGPRAGLNVSSVTKTTYSKARARASFGLMAGYKLNDLIGLQAEALYSLQGNKMTNSDHVYSYNYLKIPVLAKLYLIGGLNIEAGISFDWLVKAKETWNSTVYDINGEVTGSVSHSQNLMSDRKSFDFSIPVGINYQFSRLLDIGVRYDISTVRVHEDRKDHAKSSNWSVSVGLRF
ncbi:porin family protein [uncultured Rikenella sp.]|uniref:porin family protein n=1 Tax=uncultured Rikenella sp. TaxID=368003 RepID=UPI00262E911D|nr:porin family protein [uncultured Rikenella sp.]